MLKSAFNVAVTRVRSLVGSKRNRQAPRLSVIMPVYNVEAYVAEAIESVLDQDFRDLELIIIDDGSTDDSGALAEAYVDRDQRVRYYRKENAGLGAARNTGIELSRGRYLAFVDSDDLVVKSAYKRMVSRLERSNSDMATGNVQRFDGRSSRPGWNQSRSHNEDQFGIVLADNPHLLTDTTAWNKVFRASFWKSAGLSFVEGRLYEDLVPMTRAFLEATAIDVHSRPVYRWRVRPDRSSITQRRQDLANLIDRVDMVHACIALVKHDLDLVRYLSVKALQVDLWMYVPYLNQVSDEYDECILRSFGELWDDDLLQPKWGLPLRQAVYFAALHYLGRAKAVQALDWINEQHACLPTQEHDGQVFVVPPANLGLEETPRLAWALRDLVRPIHMVNGVRWSQTELVIEGWAYIDYLGDVDRQALSVFVKSDKDGTTVPLTVERCFLHRAAEVAKTTKFEVGDAGFRARLARSDIDWVFREHKNCTVWLTLAHGEHVFEIPVTRFDRRGAVRFVPPYFLDRFHTVQVTTFNHTAMRLQLKSFQSRLVDCEVTDDVVVLHTESASGEQSMTARFGVVKQGSSVDCEVENIGAGRHRVTVVMPDLDGVKSLPREVGRVSVRYGDGKFGQVLVADTAPDLGGRLRAHDARLVRGPRSGILDILLEPRIVLVRELDISTTYAALSVDLPANTECGLGLADARGNLVSRSDGGADTLKIPLFTVEPDGSRLPLKSGRFRVVPIGANGKLLANWEVRTGPDLFGDLPLTVESERATVTFEFGPVDSLELVVTPPLDPMSEIGSTAQRHLFERFQSADRSIGKSPVSVFLSSFGGSTFSCHPAAIGRELVRAGFEGRIFADVNDFSIAVPAGIEPVLTKSAKWYEALGSSRYIFNNTSFPLDGYPKPAGQLYVQTWHGTPLKRIGRDMVGSAVSARYLRRTEWEAAQAWDVLLSNSPFVTGILPGALAFGGRVVEVGSPRLDALVSQGDELRDMVRQRLGIGEDKMVVLYAPTWRDDYRVSELLDFQEMSRALSDDVVVLVRAHPNVWRSKGKLTLTDIDGVVDVAQYPVVEHLYAAADVLVTDYSSVMFDFAVTVRPQIFFAPDLDEYRDSERGFYLDYEATVPGPVCGTTAEVIHLLKDTPSLAATWSAKLLEFQRRFCGLEDGNASSRLISLTFGDDAPYGQRVAQPVVAPDA